MCELRLLHQSTPPTPLGGGIFGYWIWIWICELGLLVKQSMQNLSCSEVTAVMSEPDAMATIPYHKLPHFEFLSFSLKP